MKLRDVIDFIGNFESGQIFYAQKPWTLDSNVEVRQFIPDAPAPKDLVEKGYSYFLDSGTAHEVLEVFQGRKATLVEKRELLMYYAANDAFPAWVYEMRELGSE